MHYLGETSFWNICNVVVVVNHNLYDLIFTESAWWCHVNSEHLIFLDLKLCTAEGKKKKIVFTQM